MRDEIVRFNCKLPSPEQNLSLDVPNTIQHSLWKRHDDGRMVCVEMGPMMPFEMKGLSHE